MLYLNISLGPLSLEVQWGEPDGSEGDAEDYPPVEMGPEEVGAEADAHSPHKVYPTFKPCTPPAISVEFRGMDVPWGEDDDDGAW